MKKLKIYNFCIILCMTCISLYTALIECITNNHRVISNFLLIIALIAPYLVEKITKLKFNDILRIMYTIFCILSIYLGGSLNCYNNINYYDNILHFIFGIFGSIISLNLLFMFKKYDNKNKLFNILYILAMTMLMAVCWEFCEFFYDTLFNKNTQHALDTGVLDTMTDLTVAFVASLLLNLFYYLEKITNKNLLISKYMKILGDEYGK